jgi:hypothetical protein
MKKTLNMIVLIADLLPGALLVAVGLAVIVGARTGALWL